MFSPPAQKIEVSVHPAGTVSVSVLVRSAVRPRLNTLVLGLMEVVAIEKLGSTPEPVPAKLKLPVPPTLDLMMVREAFWVLVNVQLSALPAPTVIRASVSPWTKVAWKFVPSEL